MAKLVYGMNQSLDGYVDHLELRPSLALFRHFTEHVRDLTGIVYGRRMYEVMCYWDEDQADWVAEEHDFVLGRGKPFFSGPRPPLRLVTSDLVGEDVIRLTYVPA
jgi:hypothetical protein